MIKPGGHNTSNSISAFNITTNKVARKAGAKTRSNEGYDILRLKSPSIDELSDDFLCGAC
jgi:hypothetical protein